MNAPREDWAISALDADIAAQDGVVLQCASELAVAPVRWLWKYWLALGKLHILAGAPGQGKTTIALAMAANVTIGGRWPDGTASRVGNVLIWSGEDDPTDTLLPRLIAAGADRTKCYFIKSALRAGEVVPFDPARDMQKLQDAIEKIGGIGLLVVDPVVSAVQGDSHKNTEVRRALQPLVDLAAACDCAVLGITHFAKGGQGTDPTQRVVGSIAFAAVARVVMVAAKVKAAGDNEDARILARSKSNHGPDDGGFHYALEQLLIQSDIETQRIVWGQAVEGSARDLLTDPENNEESEDARDACDLLRAELHATLWTNSETASKALAAAGFSKKQIWNAGKKLNIERKKDGMKGGWIWRLGGAAYPHTEDSTTEDSHEDSEHSRFRNRESSESSGNSEPSATAQASAYVWDLDDKPF